MTPHYYLKDDNLIYKQYRQSEKVFIIFILEKLSAF